jgi:hypothetical protein
MSHNVQGVMAECSNLNLVSKLWMKIDYSPILSENFNEYNKLVEITII